MLNLKQILNSPFLGNCSTPREIYRLFLVGVFVALFLGIFKPFGLSGYPENVWPLVTLFGLVTWVFGVVFHLTGVYALGIRQDNPGWKFWKWIIYILLLLIWITIGNILLVNYLFPIKNLTFIVFLRYLLSTTAIGIFPVFLSGLISIYRNDKLFKKEAKDFIPAKETESNTPSKQLTIPSKYEEEFSIDIDSVYFLEAEENYVSVVYSDSQHNLEKELIRNTFKNIDEFLPDAYFFRCHRSFIVNLNMIEKVDGNAQGLTLQLKGTDERVPVSRSYISLLKKRLGGT